jgi:hypothetical protein
MTFLGAKRVYYVPVSRLAILLVCCYLLCEFSSKFDAVFSASVYLLCVFSVVGRMIVSWSIPWWYHLSVFPYCALCLRPVLLFQIGKILLLLRMWVLLSVGYLMAELLDWSKWVFCFGPPV